MKSNISERLCKNCDLYLPEKKIYCSQFSKLHYFLNHVKIMFDENICVFRKTTKHHKEG